MDSVLTVNIVVTTGVSVADDPALVAAVVTVGSTVVDTVLGVYIVVVDIGRPVVEVSVDDGGGLDTVVFSDETVVGDGVFKHAGKLRDYDITKREWVLDSDTVNYLNWEDLRRAIDYDISHEKEFSYKGISPDAMVEHITQFVSGLWQIHALDRKSVV